jgi:hypothetical protein
MANEWQPTLTAFVQGLESQYGAGYARSMLPQLVEVGLENDLSGRSMLEGLRAGGVSIADSTIYNTIAEVRAGAVSATEVGGFVMTGIPGDDMFAPWTTTNAESYVYRFSAAFDQLDQEGNVVETIWKPFSVNSRSPISISDAMADANASLEESDPLEYHQIYRGLTLANLYKMQPSG